MLQATMQLRLKPTGMLFQAIRVTLTILLLAPIREMLRLSTSTSLQFTQELGLLA